MAISEKEIAEGITRGTLGTFKDEIKRGWARLWGISYVRFVEDKHRCIWASATAPDGKSAMQIMTSFYATNDSDKLIKLLGARLVEPNVKDRRCHTILFMINRGSNSAHNGLDIPILPGETEIVEATFFVDPPTKERGENLTVRLAIKDQYGDEHKTPKTILTFAG